MRRRMARRNDSLRNGRKPSPGTAGGRGGGRARGFAAAGGAGQRRRAEAEHAQQRHLEAAARLGRERQVAARVQGDLVAELYVLGRERGGESGERAGVVQLPMHLLFRLIACVVFIDKAQVWLLRIVESV